MTASTPIAMVVELMLAAKARPDAIVATVEAFERAHPRSVASRRLAEAASFGRGPDLVGLFLAECTTESADTSVQSSRLHAVFEHWLRARGEQPWSNKRMTMALLSRGRERKTSARTWWLGMSLTKSEVDFARR